MKRFLLSLAVPLLLQGCIQKIAIRTMADVMNYGFHAFNEEEDIQFAHEGLAANLKLLEALIKGDPENEHLLLLASQGYSAYALAFVEDDSVERARVFYLRGRDYGLRILNENADFRKAVQGDTETFKKVLEKISNEDVPALFWTAFGWGNYINISRSDVGALADLSKVQAMMEFVLRREPGYYYAGAHVFEGSIHGSMPPMVGGKPELAKKHFDEAIRLNEGKFLMTYVYYAKTYAVQILDQELYESLLKKVLESSLDILPEARLPNAVAKKKARKLLEQTAEIF